jgi:hypothetical protein
MSKFVENTDLTYTSLSNVSSSSILQTTSSSLPSNSNNHQTTNGSCNNNNQKITYDQIASVLLKNNLTLTALELHTELSELGREVPRLRDYFSNPANFEQLPASSSSNFNQPSGDAGYSLHKASSIQTFDSLDLTRYSDDVDQSNKFQEDKIAVLEFELRKAKETINQLRNTLTIATGNFNSINKESMKLHLNKAVQLTSITLKDP